MKGENLYCQDQRGVSKEYRQGYDMIVWNTDEDEPREESAEQGDD
jgi:hypothetical protein